MLTEAAMSYHRAGLCVLPAKRAEKRPAVGAWKRYRQARPTEAELSAWMANPRNTPDAICIVCGAVSDNTEIIDFDAGGELFSAWWNRIPADLHDRLVVEITPSGGYHIIYRCESPVCGNLKLAQRKMDDKVVTLIETRGEGGLFLCAPTMGYILGHGDLANLPMLTEAERDALLQAAWELNEYLPPVVNGPTRHEDLSPGSLAHGGQVGCLPESSNRPGDDFNRRGNVRGVLSRSGWSQTRGGENEYWCRPGKNSGTSATLKDRVFYVFSSNAAPFEPGRGYSPFAVYTLLEQNGDYELAASMLSTQGYGGTIGESLAAGDDGTDISAITQVSAEPAACASHNSDVGQTTAMCDGQAAPVPDISDPGPMSADMLRMPGFVSEVMDHCLATAPYPNQVMAFAGALSLLAFLAGRKVRDSGDNRTNIYLLGLAHSASGKDWPRKINTRILHEVGLTDALGERFASGEGIQDALFQTPSMLFQTDEIDGILQSINKAKDARHEAIMSTLLTMYSSSNSVFPMRRKAGKESPGVIDQPCLVIFGTAIPNHYYEALSERMLTNGFFARMIILEAGQRGSGQEPSICDLPESVVATARWWANYCPGNGNMSNEHPVPTIIDHTCDARHLLVETREEAEAEYAKAEAKGDSVGTTVWGRVSEQVRKLALIYAISENHQSPSIGIEAVRWASRFVMHQTRRMLFMAAGHVAENPFHAECLKLMEKLRGVSGHQLPHSVLLKRMKMDAKTFSVLVETMVQQGDIEVVTVPRAGSALRMYRLSPAVKPDSETCDGGET